MTLNEALARRKELNGRVRQLQCSSRPDEYAHYSARLRTLNIIIDAANQTTRVEVPDTVMEDYKND
jgi:hypothetical protein